MASLYKRPNSPFWWIKWRDPETNKVRRESTRFRIGVGEDYKRAIHRRNQIASTEVVIGCKHQEAFSNWVEDFIHAQYTNPNTLLTVMNVWRGAAVFFKSRKLVYPYQVKRKDCQEFVTWRKGECRKAGIQPVSHNTALLHVRYLSAIFTEAFHRHYIESNPAHRLGIPSAPEKIKPEISGAEIDLIRRKIPHAQEILNASYHDWPHTFRVSFEIAIHQGCRLAETRLHVWRDVNLEAREISFHPKGGKYYTTALHPNLVPLFQELRAAKRDWTYDLPTSKTGNEKKIVSIMWRKFLTNIGLDHLCFHCTRVTVISRLERQGAPEAVVMQLVNHASTAVHRIYRRVRRSELHRYWEEQSQQPSFSPAHHPSAEDKSESCESSGVDAATPARMTTSSAERA